MKIEFSSQRREMLLFLTTNMAAVTSRANQQCTQVHILCKGAFELYAHVLDQVHFRFCLGKGFMPKKKQNSERLWCKMTFIVLFKTSETFQEDLHVSCTV